MNLLLSELFDIVEKQKDDTDRCNLLLQHNNDLVRTYLNLNFNPQVKWLLPEGTPPYKKEEDKPMLEGLHYTEADLLCLVKEKQLTKKYPSITEKIVRMVFPNLLPPEVKKLDEDIQGPIKKKKGRSKKVQNNRRIM